MIPGPMRLRGPLGLVAAGLLAAAHLSPAGSAPRGGEGSAEIASLAVYPPSVSLETARDRQRILVLATAADGTTADRTAEAELVLADPARAALEGGRLAPRADGGTELAVRLEGLEVRVPVEVRAAADDPELSFRRDVLPVLTARGCNSGGCHGAASGQDGFHLSLFGFDPAGDYHRLTRELPGRRIDRAFPDASLFLAKPTGAVPHTGGARFAPDSEAYATLLRWIEEGARDDPPEVPAVTGLELFPPEAVLAGSGRELQLLVRASYSDGTDRDVTELAVLRTSNEVAAALEDGGRLRSGQPGEAFVTASFGVQAVGIPVVVLAEDAPDAYADPAEGLWPANYIDEAIEAKHRVLRLVPAPLCSDEEFLRRAYLDVVGLLPTPEERERFLADPDPGKRVALVDALLERVEFSELWVMKWAELLRIRSNDDVSEKAALLYFEWLRDRIAENVPVDEMVRSILKASGGTFAEPATNYYQIERDDLVLAENTAQAFLGIRIQCAKCHNHPFDRWTQDDYYGFAAFFAQVGRKRAEDPRERIIFDRRRGETRHVVDKRVMRPRFLGGEEPDVRGRDRRAILADWLTAPENPWFARSLANRVWAHFMGPGVIEPVDDLRVSNPPSNGPLLDALGERLVAYGYDFKQLVRDICASRAYQRSTAIHATNAADSRNYSRAQVRRIRAETLLDVVCQVTGSPEKFQGLPLGARAVAIADGATSNYFLEAFGRAPRETVCACEVSFAPSLSQALHLLNGDTVHAKITRGGVVPELLEQGLSPGEALDALFVRSLVREPTDEERRALLSTVTGAVIDGLARGKPAGESLRLVLEDVFWALCGSREFLFQH